MDFRSGRRFTVTSIALATPALCALLLAPPTNPGSGAKPGTPSYAEHVPNEVLIKFKPAASEPDKASLRAELGARATRNLTGALEQLKLGHGMTTPEAIARYGAHSLVEYVEPNYIVRADTLPDDPRFPELYGLRNTGQTGGTPGADIGAEQAWDVTTGSPAVLVAVIDTGVDRNHPDLAANIWTNPGEIAGNGIDDDGNGFVDDVHGWDFVNNDNDPFDDRGHGTHVAGTIGAVGDSGEGVTGVSWKVSIVPIKFLNSGGTGSTADAIRAVEYATLIGADIANNSWGGGAFSEALLDAIEAAADAELLFVASSGNSGRDTDVFPHFPSSYEVRNVVSVAATDHRDLLAGFSNYGAISVDLAAPGVDILSTLPGNNYGLNSGTSMASPHVSGVAALIRAVVPQIGMLELKSLLLDNVTPVPDLDGVVATGGRLNAFLPIAVQDEVPPDPIHDLTTRTPTSNSVSLDWTASGDDGGDGTAARYDVRFSSAPIDPFNFAMATPAGGAPRPLESGTPETMEVLGLEPGTTYYFAIRVRDEWGNASPIGNVASGTTEPAPVFASAPGSFDLALFTGQVTTQEMFIQNVGAGNLDWRIPLPVLDDPVASELRVPLALDKGEPDPRTGDAVPAGSGGPDGFGYRFITSDEPTGPRFSWNEIALSGTPVLPLDGDDQLSETIPLPFEFPFYGRQYDSVRICTNGWLSFSTEATVHANQPLPTAAGPRTLIAPFWDDLDFKGAYRVVQAATESSFTVQYIGVPRFSGPGSYTFQVTLESSGRILFSYRSLTGEVSGATVGIQDSAHPAGLELAFNNEFLHDGMTVAIVPQWVTVSASEGRLFAGETDHVAVTFDARGLDPGSYSSSIDVFTNDPTQPLVAHPVTLTISGAPAIAADPPELDFGVLIVGDSLTLPLTLSNIGTDLLTVSDIAAADPAIAVELTTLTIPAGGSHSIDVTFAPTVPAPLAALLTITSDAPNAPALELPLTGSALPSPAIEIAPASFSENLFTGDVQTRLLAVTNSGESDLELAFFFEGPGGGTPVVTPLSNGGFENGDFSGWTALSNGASQLTPWQVSSGFGGYFGNSSPIEGNFDALNGFDGEAGLEYSLYRDIDVPAGVGRAELTFFDRIQYDSLGIFSSLPRIYEATIQDPAGNVLLTIAREEILLSGRGYTDLGWQPRSANLLPFAGQTVRLHLREYIPESYTGPANIEFDDFRIDIEGFPAWLQVMPLVGTVPPGQTRQFEVRFDAGDTGSSLFEGAIRIETNIPLTPSVTVPASLGVVGAPNLAVSGGPVTIESSIDYGVDGALTRHALAIGTTPVGEGSIELVVDGEFFSSSETATATAEGLTLGSIGGVGIICIESSKTFPVAATDLALLAQDGVVNVDVQNSVGVSTSCTRNNHTVRLEYHGSIDPVDFGSAYVGWPVDRSILVENRGADQLEISAISSDRAEFSVSTAPFELAPGASLVVPIRFSSAVPGIFDGRLDIISNDPDTPVRSIDLTAAAVEPPVIGVSPSTLSATLPTGAADTQLLTISNGGGSPLDYELSVVAETSAGPGAEFEALTSSPFPLTCVVGDPATGLIYAQANGGTAFYRYRTSSDSWESLSPAPIHSGNNGGATMLDGKIYTAYTERSELGVYDIAADSWSTIPAPLGFTGQITADDEFIYQLSGTSLVRFDPGTMAVSSLAVAPFFASSWGGMSRLDGTIYAHQGNSGQAFAAYDVAANQWTALPPLPGGGVLGAVVDPFTRHFYAYGSYSQQNLYRFSIDQGSWETLTLPYAVHDGGMAWLGSPAGIYFVQGEQGTAFSRLITAVPFVTVDPSSGSVAPSAADEVTVRFDALTLSPGTYEAQIVVSSNDPVTAQLGVTVDLTVIGIPDIEVEATLLDFGTVFVGGVGELTLDIANLGNDFLEISSIGSDASEFSPATTVLSVPPGSSVPLTVAFTPGATGPFDGTLSIASNDPDSPLITVALSGSGVEPPIVGVDPQSLVSSLPEGGTETQILTVSNSGPGPLTFSLSVVPAASFLSVEPAAGLVPPFGTLDVQVQFDAAAVPAGTHAGSILVASDDPTTPLVTVSATLTVIGAPNLTVGLPVSFESALDFGTSGARSMHSLAVPLAPSGAGVVELTVNGDFGSAGELATLEAEARLVGTLGEFGADCTPGSAEFAFTAAELAALLADGVAEFSVTNTPAVDPICNVNRHTVRLSYNLVLGLLDLGSVFVGLTADAVVVVENLGSEPLIIDALTFDTPEFSSTTAALSLAPGSSETVPVSFTSSATGTFNGTLTLSSNDPDTPLFSLALTATTVEPPQVGVAPSSISAALNENGQETRTLTISNTGGSPLEASITVSPFATPWLSVTPAGATVQPGGTFDVAVTLDASATSVGAHSASLLISSNDPQTPLSIVPVDLTVSGTPRIVLGGDRVTLDSTQDYSVGGAQTLHQFAIDKPPAGNASLELVAEGDFGSSTETATATAEGFFVGTVGGIGSDCTAAVGTFGIDAGVMAALVADGVVTTVVRNSNAVGAICPLNRHRLRLSYDPEVASLEFGDVFIGAEGVQVIDVRNTGTDLLQIDSIASDTPEFSVSPTSLSLAPGAGESVTVTFTPASAMSYQATLSFTSNDPVTPVLTRPMSGAGVDPPVLGIAPARLDSTQIVGAEEVQLLTLSNAGGSPLEFEVQGLPASNTEGEFELLAPSPFPLTCIVADPSSGHIYGQYGFGPFFYRYSVSTGAWEELAGAPFNGPVCSSTLLDDTIYILFANQSTFGVYDIPNNTWTTRSAPLPGANITNDGEFLYQAWGPLIVRIDLSTGSVVALATPPFTFENNGAIRYLDGVIYGHRGGGTTGFAALDIAANQWTVLPPLPAGAVPGAAIDPFERNYFAYGPQGGRDLFRYSIDDNSWESLQIPFFTISNGGGLAWLPFPAPGVYFTQGMDGPNFARLTGGISFVEIDPATGAVPAAGQLDIGVRFKTGGLPPGLYESSLLVASNDPVNPEQEVPISLTIITAPDIVVGEIRTLESRRSYFDSGATTRHDFDISGQATGSGSVQLIAEGDYSSSVEIATLSAEGLTLGSLSNTGSPCTAQTATFALGKSVVTALTEDGQVSIDVANSPFVSPVCAVNRHTVGLTLRAIDETVDFGQLFLGSTRDRLLFVDNRGSDELVVDSIASDSAEFSVSTTALTVAPGASATVTVSFTALAAGTFNGTLTLTSDDPDSPVVELVLTGEALELPVIAVDPTALDLSLAEGAEGTRTLTLLNSGAGQLDFSVSVVPLQASFVTLDPAAGSVAPGGATAVSVQLRTAGLAPGLHTAELHVASNDPLTPLVTVPLSLSVTASPNIAVTGLPITLESSQSYNVSGATTAHLIPIEMPSTSGATLELVADGDYGSPAETAAVVVEGQTFGAVGGIGLDCSPATQTYSIDAVEFAALAADGAIEVEVRNSPFVDPLCEVNRHTLRLNYELPAEELDFGSVFVDHTGEHTIRIHNAGSLPLAVSSIDADLPEFTASLDSVSLAPGDAVELTIVFAPQGPGTFDGTLSIASDDPDTPVVAIPLGAVSLEPPVIGVAPASIETTLLENEIRTELLTLSTSGGSLDFSVEVIGSGPDFVSVDPTVGSLAPGGSADLNVTLSAAMAPGIYAATIRVSSNDPVTPQIDVAVTLTVIGAPDIVVFHDAVVEESTANFDISGWTPHDLDFPVTPVAGGTIELIAEGDFGATNESATAIAEGLVIGSVGGVGFDCVPATGVFPIAAADLAQLASDGIVHIDVVNSSSVDVICSENRHTVRLIYSVPAEQLDFGTVLVGQSGQLSLQFRNTGSERLEVGSIAADAPEFSVSAGALSLDPGASATVVIGFVPVATGPVSGELTITSDDPDTPLIVLPLTAVGAVPAQIGVTPAAFASTLLQGGVESQTLFIANSGGLPLDFSLSVLPAAALSSSFEGLSGQPAISPDNAQPLDPVDDGDGTAAAESVYTGADALFEPLDPSPVALTCVVADPSSGQLYAQAAAGVEFYRYAAIADGWERLADSPLGSSNNCGAAMLNGQLYTAHTAGTPLGRYDIETDTWSTIPIPQGLETGNIAGDGQNHLYLAAGSNLVRIDPESGLTTTLAQPPFPFERWGGLRHLNGVLYGHQGNGLTGFAAYDIANDRWNSLPPLPAGAVLGAAIDPVAGEYVTAGSYLERNIYRYSIATQAWRVSTVPFFELDDGGMAWLPGPVPGILVVQGQQGTGFTRLIAAAALESSFVGVEPSSGTVLPGDSFDVAVRFDTLDLLPGTVEALIRVDSNDPATPVIEVPASLTVVGVPDIMLGESVRLESVIDFTISGATTQHAFPVEASAPEGATLELLAEGDYGSSSETATALAEGSLLGSIGGVGQDCDPAAGTFSISAAEFTVLAADGLVEIEVRNSSSVNPFCAENRHSVRLVYDDPLEALDFGTVFVGYSKALPVRIANLGHGELSATISSDQGDFIPASSAIVIPPMGTARFDVNFTPSTAGDVAGTLAILSNDPDEPLLSVDLTGSALVPPVARVAPPAVEATLPPLSDLPKTKTIRLDNSGGSDLAWNGRIVEILSAEETVSSWVDRPKGYENDNGAGVPSIEHTGGPDAFGYRFVDSEEPDGPSFSWIDISAVERSVPLTGDDQNSGPVPIGFAFPFYGETFDSLRICTNGWLSLTSEKSTFSNPDALPNDGFAVPENLIAPFWDDLHLRGAERISYHGDATRFVVQYSGVDRFSSAADLTFQVVLYPSGRILFQYLSMSGELESATTGIQNADRTTGLLVNYNQQYIQDGLAIEIVPIPRWLSIDPANGIIPAGGFSDIVFDFSSADLHQHDYAAQFSIGSNDPVDPIIDVPVTFHVREVALDHLQVDPNTLNLGSNGKTVRASLQLPPEYDPHAVVVSSVSINGELFANAAPVSFEDETGDGVEELVLKFDREALQQMIPEGIDIPLTVTGEVEDITWFSGTYSIRAICPQLTAPNGGEIFVTGETALVDWAAPDWSGNVTYDLILSRDGGESWELLASGVEETEYGWNVAGPVTTEALIRVFASSGGEVIGFDTSDEAFAISDIFPPRPISGLELRFDGADVILEWPAPSTDPTHGPAEQYRVLRAFSAEGPFEEVGWTASEQYHDPQSNHGSATAVFYKVVSFNSGGAATN